LVVAFLYAMSLLTWISSAGEVEATPSQPRRCIAWFCAALVASAIAITFEKRTRIYAFAVWVVAGVVVGVFYPDRFLLMRIPLWNEPIRGIDQISWLISLAMFGMGATLTLQDFRRVLRMPKGVATGFALQFGIMPLLGWSVANWLRFPPEIAAGVILTGACPGGVSSNVVTYLARGNVALSVTMTACTTLAAPFMTPLMMFLLAGQTVPVNYWDMMRSIALTVVGPVVAGLIVNQFLTRMRWQTKTLESGLAVVSIVAICWICTIIAANSHQALQSMGWLLLVGVLFHNGLGYTLGYWGARAAGLNVVDARTIAIEVGLQNGGMAANLATNVLKNANAAIAPAVFAPVMNITGSLLATWWSQHPSKLEEHDSEIRSGEPSGPSTKS
jgi:BASS family bile acid:Na+ symporter